MDKDDWNAMWSEWLELKLEERLPFIAKTIQNKRDKLPELDGFHVGYEISLQKPIQFYIMHV